MSAIATYIRPATTDDFAAMSALAWRTISASYRSFLGDEAVDGYHGRGADDEELRKHLETTDLLFVDEQLAGLVVLIDDLIHLLLVDPACWRRGYARKLMDHAEAKLAAAGYRRGRLECFAANHGALAFYAAQGWQEVRRAPAPELPEQLVAYMEKELV